MKVCLPSPSSTLVRATAICVALVSLIAPSAKAQCQLVADTEANNSVPQAQVLGSVTGGQGFLVTGVVDNYQHAAAWDFFDVYRLQAVTSVQLDLFLVPGEPTADIALWLTDSAGSIIEFFDNEGAGGAEGGVWLASPGQTFHLVVLASGPGTDYPNTSYDLSVSTGPLNCKDCNDNSLPDTDDINAGTSLDCNTNGVPDECEIAAGTSLDCDTNGVPDECQPDCDGDGAPDVCEGEPDCNTNGIPDSCDISAGTSLDCNTNGVPDGCG